MALAPSAELAPRSSSSAPGSEKPLLANRRSWTSPATDELSLHYSAMADDSKQAEEKREAALLFSMAEGHLEDEEDFEEALRAGQQALAIFRRLGDAAGMSDSLRLVIDAMRQVDVFENRRPLDATRMAEEEWASFQRKEDKKGQAAMLLSLAGLTFAKRGDRNQDVGVRQGKEALAAYRDLGDQKMEGVACLTLAELLIQKKSCTEAVGFARKALDIFEKLGDRRKQAQAHHLLGLARVTDRQFDGGIKALHEALAIYKQEGLKKQEAFEQYAIAWCNLDMEDGVQAGIKAAQESLAILQSLERGKRVWVVSALCAEASGHLSQKNAEAAEKVAKKVLADFREASDSKGVADALHVLSQVLLENNDDEGAQLRAEEALAIVREEGDRKREAAILYTLSRVQLQRKDVAQALSTVREAAALFKKDDDLEGEGGCNFVAVSAHLEKKKLIEAMAAAQSAQELFRKAADKHCEGRTLLLMSTVHCMQEEEAEAVSVATEAQYLFHKDKDLFWEAFALHSLAEIQVYRQNLGAGLKAAKRALGLLQELDDRAHLASILTTVASIQVSLLLDAAPRKRGKLPPPELIEEAHRAAEKALEVSQKLSEKQLVIPNKFSMAMVYIISKRPLEAHQCISDGQELCKKLDDKEGQVVALVLSAYAHLVEAAVSKATEVVEEAIELAEAIEDTLGKELAANAQRAVLASKGLRPEPTAAELEAAAGAASAAGASAEPEIDPEMLKLKIVDVALSLMGSDQLESDTPLMDAGLDSLSMVEFRNELVKEFPGVDLPGALLFDYPTINALVDFVAEGLRGGMKGLT